MQTQLQCGARGQSINRANVTQTSELLANKDEPCHESDACCCLAESLASLRENILYASPGSQSKQTTDYKLLHQITNLQYSTVYYRKRNKIKDKVLLVIRNEILKNRIIKKNTLLYCIVVVPTPKSMKYQQFRMKRHSSLLIIESHQSVWRQHKYLERKSES